MLYHIVSSHPNFNTRYQSEKPMNGHPPRRPDAVTYGVLAYAVLFLWPIPFVIASVIVAPFVLIFDIERLSALHWWMVGIVGVFLIAGYVGYKSK